MSLMHWKSVQQIPKAHSCSFMFVTGVMFRKSVNCPFMIAYTYASCTSNLKYSIKGKKERVMFLQLSILDY